MLYKNVYIIADNIFSPLGKTTAENFAQLKSGASAVRIYNRPDLSDTPVAASLFPQDQLQDGEVTRFEQMLIASVADALGQANINPADPKTGLIISSTKGNINLIEGNQLDAGLSKRVALTTSAAIIAKQFGFTAKPVIISNACISGVVAIITAMRMIQSGEYNNVVVTGADVISKFVTSGFQSFHALSSEACKPFDKNRDGLNLGEGAATVILSGDEKYKGQIRVTGGGVSNDANHISGPSRTGQELADAITFALKMAGIKEEDIDLILAHGTATPYNDEMETKAIALAGVQRAAVNGTKGYYGHTLGAAGLIESIVAAECMRQGVTLATRGFEEPDTTALQVTTRLEEREIKHCLKTASGFGGCNAALVLSK